MAFIVGDIIKKKTGSQKYKVIEVLDYDRYKCRYEPNFAPSVSFTFKGLDLVKV